MRISAREGDRGYVEIADRPNYIVFLDDVEQQHVITADTDEGYVLRLKTDANGEPEIADDEWAVEELRGVVRIEVQ